MEPVEPLARSRRGACPRPRSCRGTPRRSAPRRSAASALVHSANRTRTSGPGRFRSVAAANVAVATSSGGEPGRGRPAEHLGDDPGQRLRAAALGRPIGDVGAGPVAARDVAGIGQPLVDRPDRVRVDPEGGPELADRGKPGTGQQPSGVDLVGDLPVDLGRDRDVRIALDVEVSGGPRERAVGRGQLARRRDLRVT